MPSPEDTFCRMLWRIKHDVSRASLFAKHEKPTNTYEMLGQTRNAHQNPRNARPNAKSPPIPTKCSAKHEMPTNTYKMLGQTRKAHQYLRKASAKHEMPTQTHEKPRPNTKSPPIPTKCFSKTRNASPNPDLTPGPSPMGRGEHAS